MKKIQAAFALLMIVALIAVPVFNANALLNEAEAVHINPAEIEAGTLIIGTHLIHISALSESVYSIAGDSATTSGQSNRYYKSELADGTWLDISDAANLSDITATGKVVTDSLIKELWLTHHTKSDQITYDLRTGQSVNPYDITDPYDVSGLSEFEELTLQYDELSEREELSESDEDAVAIVQELYGMTLTDEDTERWDKLLANMQQCKEQLAAENNSGLQGTLDAVMESADASRRAIVYEKLSGDGANDILSKLQKTGKESLIQSLSNSLLNAAEALLENDAKIMGAEAGTLGEAKNEQLQELYASIEEGDYDKVGEQLENLKSLINASEGKMQSEQDYQYTKENLVPAAENAFKELLTSGVSEQYKELTGVEDTTKNVLEQMLKEQKNELAVARMELQSLLQILVDSAYGSEQANLLEQMAEHLAGFEEAIPADDFAAYAAEEIQSYSDKLNQLQKALSGGSPTDKERAKLEQEKAENLLLKADALDRNDLAKAKEYDLTLAEIDKKLDELGGSSQPAIEAAKEDTLSAIQNGEYEDAQNGLDNLASSIEGSSSEVLAALKEIYTKLNTQMYLADENTDASSCKELSDNIETLIAENADLLDDELSTDEITNLLEEIIGSSLKDADDAMQAAALVAIHLYGEHLGSKPVRELAAELAEQLKKTNQYLYLQCSGTVEYLPTKTIGKCMEYRYVFYRSQMRVTLSKRGTYHEFYANQKQVKTGTDSGEEMNYGAKYQKTLYIDEDYAYQTFGCQAVYLTLSNQAVLVTDEIMEQAEAIFADLLEQGGE